MSNQTLQTGIELGNAFERDELLAAQFYCTARRSYHGKPELRLMAAILEDAVATLTTDQRRSTSRQSREFADTLEWIAQSEEREWVFSFASICESLGIDPAYLRQGLLRKISENRAGEIPTGEKRRLGYRSSRRKIIRLRAG